MQQEKEMTDPITARSIEIEVTPAMDTPEAPVDPGPTHLPWGAYRERQEFPDVIPIPTNTKPGEFILQTLFAEFTVLAEKKIEQVLDAADQQKPLSKSLQRGEDPSFDQLLSALNSVAEHCLPSLLQTLFQWYERQIPAQDPSKKTKPAGEKDFLVEKRELAIEFIFLMVLIEVLKQLPYHPGHDDLVNHIIVHAFKHFKYKEGTQSSPNAVNMNIIADLSAEVMGVLAQSRFPAVRKYFFSELKELRSKEQNPFTTQAIISLLMGMKFFRVKMHPIEEFQASIQFLQECGNYFLEVKDKDIKHALAGLFVEILLPVAAVVKNEVNVPVLKNFVEMLYSSTLDIANKKKHSLALFPMVTCLLCVSQKQFFLNNWPYFLTMCLSHLKDRDPKMARVSLESLYRLLWVYMIRIKCESNTATNSRLQSIVNSLFPKGSKVVVPRDTPLNIFVKIIQFIGQERLDFAMREIIYDLLYVGRPIRFLTPERMSIGLRSFLVIADSLQRKEADPPMPQTMGVMPSGNTLRFKKTFINKYLSDDTAKMIGMSAYYPHVRKAFDSILRLLDSQVGKPMLMTKTENVNREPEEIITGERKPKIDLFRTCVAAVPRLLPEGMSQHELIELLSRLTVHMDDELGKLAFQSLQNIVVDLPEWRNDVLRGFVQFIQKEVNDTFPQLLDQCNRRLISLLTQWKTVAQSAQANKEKLEKQSGPSAPLSHHMKMTERFHGPKTPRHYDPRLDPKPLTGSKEELAAHKLQKEHGHQRATLHELEGFALVMLCSCKPIVRKLAVVILKEVRNLFGLLNIPKDTEPCVLDVMDRSCPVVIERVLPYLPQTEKAAALSASPLDFQWLADRTSIIWTSAGYHDMNDNNSNHAGSSSTSSRFEAWIECMSIFMHHEYVMGHCPTAVSSAWPILYGRLQALFTHVDPNNTVNESRTSSILGRPGSKKLTNERDLYMNLWQNYVVMGCCIAPSNLVSEQRSASPELTSSPDSTNSERLEVKSPSANMTAKDLFKTLVPLIRCDVSDMRETVVIGLGRINPEAFRDLTDELVPIIKEAIDRKQENVRRRKRRDVLRLALVRIFRYMAQNGIFAQSPAGVIEQSTNALCMTFVEYIEGARLFLENEGEKELPILQEIRLHFAEFCRHLIRNTPIEMRGKLLSRDLRYSLFYLFASWSGKFGSTFGANDRRSGKDDRYSELELTAVQAMSAVLCCGPVFDPSGLNDDGYIYSWLDTLLGAHEEKIKTQIYKLAQETVVLLLEFNPDAQALLDWVIDRCYTGSHEVADGCFNALASVFNNREYPCDHVAMLNVTLLNTGCPRIAIHETAVQLLHLLYKRFFLDDVCMTSVAPEGAGDASENDRDAGDDSGATGGSSTSGPRMSKEEEERMQLQDMLLSGPYSRSQLWLSETLARLHPELTMPIFSEITHRFQTAVPALRQVLLQYLLPWLYNMELVDPNLCNPHSIFLSKLGENRSVYAQPFLRGEGWGSPQATEMVLNNLMYITCKFGDDHAKEIEELWAALVACWPCNLKVIIRYIIIITGMAPANLLPYTKRVVVYLGRAKPEHVVDEMMNELQTVEALTFHIERTQTPPFYRLTSQRTRASTTAVLEEQPEHAGNQIVLDKGQIHTKRHSGEDPSKIVTDITPRTNSAPSLKTEASTTSSIASSVKTTTTESDLELEALTLANVPIKQHEQRNPDTDTPTPYPLPMPAYGGYFAPLSELLPEGNLPNPPYQRCNLAVMLMTDLIVDGIDIDWTIHLPHILHIIFLGLDNSRSLIHEHCKKLLLNLLLVLSAHNDHFSVAKILLSNKAANEDTALTLPNTIGKDFKFIEGAEGGEPGPDAPPAGRKSLGSGTLATDSVSSLVDVDLLSSTEDVAKALIEFLVTRKCRPLWSYEDITAKVHSIRSAEQLEHFLRYSLRIFNESLPQAHIEQRWALVALQLALCCSSRHYAGRSFQVFRALHVPLTTQMLSDILSRLVETVAEQGEDMQGYVTEIILTLEAAVDNLNVDFRPIDFVKELFLSTPNLNKEPRLELKKSATVALRQSTQHYRSTSYSLANVVRRPVSTVEPSPPSESKESRQQRVSTGELDSRKNTNLSRSRSAQSLKQLQDPTGHDDKLTILTQMFWIAVSLLESDYEHEFLLAVRLLDKILKHIQPDRPECREKLDKILQQIQWPGFPGVQALLLKGCTSPVTAEPTWALLSKLTLCINAPAIDPSQCVGFPMNVIALLPYLVEHYEENNKICTEAADHISQMCMEQSGKLDNLATVMTLYSRGVFGKDNFQWTKCVIKYLFDVYSNLSVNMIAVLVEILEKGPATTQSAVLQILHCIIHYIDITSSPAPMLNAELFRVVSRYVELNHWREAVKILKLCVTRSSTLSAPPPSMLNMSSTSILESSLVSLPSHTSFAEAEVSLKKELPGRTIDFTFDVSQASIIGKKHLDLPSTSRDGEPSEKEKSETVSDKASQITTTTTSSGQSNGDVVVSGWKKPQLSQSRTRERLVNLLTSYGQRVGLPKSPSENHIHKVIFSQSSDTIERQASMCSSSEEASVADGEIKMDDNSSADPQFQVFKDFDFLDIELDEMSDGVDKFNWGVKRHSPSLEEAEVVNERSRSNAGSLKEDSSDDEEYTSSITSASSINSSYSHGKPSVFRVWHSIHSAGSDADMTDISPGHASPNFSNMAVLCIQSDEIEDIWRSHVNRVMTDSTATYAVNTFHLFARLLQETQRKLQTLTKEACYFLSKTDSVRSLAHQLSSMLELLTTEMECPLVYADVETLTACKMIERHKFSILEIHESYETYLLRKEQANECLDGLKSSVKLQSLGESMPDFCGDEQKVELCRCLYKLHFQLLQLFEGYSKLINSLAQATKPPQIDDLSEEVMSLREDLQKAQQEVDADQEAISYIVDVNTLSREDAEKLLIDCMNSKQFVKAVVAMRNLRPLFPGDMFGVNPSDEVEGLLFIYCKHQAEAKPGVVAITKSDHDLSEVCTRLMDIKVQLSVVIAQIEQQAITPTAKIEHETLLKLPESSTL